MSNFRQPTDSWMLPNTRRRVWLAALLLVAVTVTGYHNTFSVPFLFDDLVSIVENPALAGRDTNSGATPTPAGGLTTSGRPVLALTLALNRLVGGEVVAGYHAVNLLIHICAGLCLFGLMRRTLVRPELSARFGTAALPIAFVVALLWLLHPLQTAAVTYIVQRAESLAGLFYLLTLYAFVRATERKTSAGNASPSERTWLVLAVVACALGMGTKETVATAPVVVMLYDRCFVSGTFRAAWQRHRSWYLLLGATWIILGALLLQTEGRGGTAGFGTEVSPWAYALTQCRAIARYLALSVWPAQLVFDYGVTLERRLINVLPQAVALLALLAGALVAWRGRAAVGFAGVSFFVLLAPTSSFVPIATQTMAEHRMYLPLAVVIGALVLAAYRQIGFGAVLAGLGVGGAVLVATIARNDDYRNEVAIWSDTVGKWPTNARAHNNLGQAQFRVGAVAESIACYEAAIRHAPEYPEPHYNLGVSLARLGQPSRAIEHYEAALRLEPRYAEAHNNLGTLFVQGGRIDAALRHYEQAVAVRPGFAEAHNNLGDALLQAGRTTEAIAQLERALALKPDYAKASYNLGNARAATGAMAEALAQYQRALNLQPDYAEAHVNAGNALLALGRANEALASYERAIALDPKLADAHFNLGSALLELGRWADAIPRFEAALRLRPAFARAHRALGFALAQLGRTNEAVSHYEQYVRAEPGDAEARAELRQLRARR